MKCESCKDKAEVMLSWKASERQEGCFCGCCASLIWNKLHERFTGTESFNTFTVEQL
jgi:hypothetical protein